MSLSEPPCPADWMQPTGWTAVKQERLLPHLTSIAEDYGYPKSIVARLLQGTKTYHVLDSSMFSNIYGDKFDIGKRGLILMPLFGKGIFTTSGHEWKIARRRLQRQLASLASLDPRSLEPQIQKLLSSLETATDPRTGLADLQPAFFRLTLNIVLELFLVGPNSEGPPFDHDGFARSFDRAQDGIADRLRLGDWYFLYNPPRFRAACQEARQYIDNWLTTRGRRSQGGGCLLQTPLEQDRDEILNFLLAGRDTTASCLSWTFRLLVRHPSVLRRLREEVSQVCGLSHDIGQGELDKMQYLRHIIQESLRLYPPIPLNSRRATQDTVLGGSKSGCPGGLRIRAGEAVVTSSYVQCRNHHGPFGTTAAKFDPDRWDDSSLETASGSFLPFGIGPRACLGKKVAQGIISYAIVRLIQTYPNIELPDSERGVAIGEERQKVTLVLSCAEGCKVILGRGDD